MVQPRCTSEDGANRTQTTPHSTPRHTPPPHPRGPGGSAFSQTRHHRSVRQASAHRDAACDNHQHEACERGYQCLPRSCSPTEMGRAARCYAGYAGSRPRAFNTLPQTPARRSTPAPVPSRSRRPPVLPRWPPHQRISSRRSAPTGDSINSSSDGGRGGRGQTTLQARTRCPLRSWLTWRRLGRARRGQHRLVVGSCHPLEVVQRPRRLHACGHRPPAPAGPEV